MMLAQTMGQCRCECEPILPGPGHPALAQVLSFAACPESENKNVPTNNAGGSTDGFDNFNLSVRPDLVKPELAEWVHISRGQVATPHGHAPPLVMHIHVSM